MMERRMIMTLRKMRKSLMRRSMMKMRVRMRRAMRRTMRMTPMLRAGDCLPSLFRWVCRVSQTNVRARTLKPMTRMEMCRMRLRMARWMPRLKLRMELGRSARPRMRTRAKSHQRRRSTSECSVREMKKEVIHVTWKVYVLSAGRSAVLREGGSTPWTPCTDLPPA